MQMQSPVKSENKLEKLQPKMEKQDSKNDHDDQLKNQGSRRSRKDVDGRDFICGCGKKYLSYPALYTHIKTKHDGQQPQGTLKSTMTVPPKKSKTKVQEEHIVELASMVSKQDIPLLDIIDQKLHGYTPVSARFNRQFLSRDIIEVYNGMMKITNPLKLNKESSLQQHLVAYLIGVGQFVCERLHEQYQLFAKSLKQCYYQMGNQVYQKCFSRKDQGLGFIPEFKVEKVKYTPIICDFYIRFYLDYQYKQLNANLMELILTDFCKWLRKKKNTFIEVILTKDYALQEPLYFEEVIKNENPNLDQNDQDSNQNEEAKIDESNNNNKQEQSQKQMQKNKLKEQSKQQQNNISNPEQIAEKPVDKNQIEQQAAQNDADQSLPKGVVEQQSNKQQKQIIAQAVNNEEEVADNQPQNASVLETERKQPQNSINGHWSLQPQPAQQQSQDLPPLSNPQIAEPIEQEQNEDKESSHKQAMSEQI